MLHQSISQLIDEFMAREQEFDSADQNDYWPLRRVEALEDLPWYPITEIGHVNNRDVHCANQVAGSLPPGIILTVDSLYVANGSALGHVVSSLREDPPRAIVNEMNATVSC